MDDIMYAWSPLVLNTPRKHGNRFADQIQLQVYVLQSCGIHWSNAILVQNTGIIVRRHVENFIRLLIKQEEQKHTKCSHMQPKTRPALHSTPGILYSSLLHAYRSLHYKVSKWLFELTSCVFLVHAWLTHRTETHVLVR
jgi:hypothetical protein